MALVRLANFVILSSLLTSVPAGARIGEQAFMPDGVAADAPMGFTDMCRRDATLCLLGVSGNARTAAQTDLHMLAKAINSDVNRHVTQRTDIASVGIPEYWQRLAAHSPVGDCEDIAIEKRIRLAEAGFPAERMFYGVAFVRKLGLHTVLIVRLDDGDYVLDSITPHVLRWEQSHYVWLRKQVPGSPMEWQRIDGGTTTTIAARDTTPAS